MEKTGVVYLFNRADQGVFVEVYFPKKGVYQEGIFGTLRVGYDEKEVKIVLRKKLESLFVTLADYPHALFDPYRYGTMQPPPQEESLVEKAMKRIDMYISPFKGWSMYEVDGVFFGKDDKEYEERVQVIRLMFRFASEYASVAAAANCADVLRSILFFTMRERGNIEGETPWDEMTKQQFMATHEPWRNPAKRKFADEYFSRIAAEARKWIDDCGIFVFAYLIRELADRVLEAKGFEEEIWVATFFGLLVNVTRRVGDGEMLL